jgi:hypothetical protein
MAAQHTVEANVSAGRRPDMGSAAATNNEAAASTAKARGHGKRRKALVWRAHKQHRGGVGYGDGAPRGENKAMAFAARLACVTMAARRMGDEEAAAVALTTTRRRMMVLPRDGESDNDIHQGKRQQRWLDARELTRWRLH